MQNKSRIPRIITITITIVILLCLTAAFGEWYLGKKGYGYMQLYDPSPEAHDNMACEGPGSRPKRALCLGCSYTFGMGVPQEDNYVSQLNKLIPDCSFDNCGDCGSEAFMSLQHETWRMKERKYDLVTYAMIDKHLFRPPDCCVLIDGKVLVDPNPNIARILYYANDYPLLLDGKEHKLTVNFYDYYLPGSQHSRLLSFLSDLRLRLPMMNYHHSGSSILEVKLQYLIRTLYTFAHKHGAKFAVIALNELYPITNDAKGMTPLNYYTKSKLTPNDTPVNIPALDASYPVDIMSKPELHTAKSSIDNGDHPSALVHKYYAKRISEFIKKEHLLD